MKFQRKPVNEIGIILIRKHPALCRAGAVDEDIAAAKGLLVRVERRPATVKRAQIGGVCLNPTTCLRGNGLGRRRAMRRIASGNHDIRAVACQPRGNGKPDATRSPRYEGRFSLK